MLLDKASGKIAVYFHRHTNKKNNVKYISPSLGVVENASVQIGHDVFFAVVDEQGVAVVLKRTFWVSPAKEKNDKIPVGLLYLVHTAATNLNECDISEHTEHMTCKILKNKQNIWGFVQHLPALLSSSRRSEKSVLPR
jgi:hypothetical protein